MFFILKTLFSFFVLLSSCLCVFSVLIRLILWGIAVSSAYRADIPMTIERQIWSFGKNYFELWKVNTLKTKWCILHSNWIIFSHMRWILLHIYHAYLHDICLFVLLLLLHFYLSSGEIYAKWAGQFSRKFLMKI